MKPNPQLVLALAGLLLPISASLAQQPANRPALGGGHALDANSRVGGNGRNEQTQDINALIRFNDAVVTGSAGGGKSFRGPLGYRAPSDFHDFSSASSRTRSSTYNFSRDSAASGLAGTGIRSSDVLKYQFDLSSGRTSVDTDPRISLALTPSRSNDASSGTSLKSMRSISQYESAQARRPSVLGVTAKEDGTRTAVVASTLRGITSQRLDDRLSPPGLPTGPENLAARPERPTDAPRAPLNNNITPERANAGIAPARIEPTRSSYDAIVDRFKTAAESRGLTTATTPAGTPAGTGARPNPTQPAGPNTPADARNEQGWRKELNRLRDRLALKEPAGDTPTTVMGPKKPADYTTRLREDLARPARPSRPLRPGEKPPIEKPEETPRERADRAASMPTPPAASTPPPRTPAELYYQNLVRKSLQDMSRGEPVKDFLKVESGVDDEYARRMSEGRLALSAGRYFDAETAFGRAMISRSEGNIASRVGRLHAQIGGGLYSSAGSGLQLLFGDHPEMIPVRFDAAALPAPERVTLAINALRRDVKDPAAPLGPDAAFLLAYLGHQTQDKAVLDEGLAGLQTRLPSMDLSRTELAKLLLDVWGNKPLPELPKPEEKPPAAATPDAKPLPNK